MPPRRAAVSRPGPDVLRGPWRGAQRGDDCYWPGVRVVPWLVTFTVSLGKEAKNGWPTTVDTRLVRR